MGNVNGAGRSAWNRNLIQDGSVNIKFNGFESGSTETFNVIYDDFSKNTSNTSWYSFAVTHIAAHNILGGGVYYVEGFKTNERYEWQKATSYESTSIRQFARSKVNGAWNEWVRII